MPEFIERTAPFRENGTLESVFLATTTDYGLLKQRLDEYAIGWPVLLFSPDPHKAMNSVPQAEWQVRGNPIAFLINPAGVIVGSGPGAKPISELLTALEFYTSQAEPDPPLGLRCSWNLDDLPQVGLYLELSSPRRAPLDIEIDYRYVGLVFDDAEKLIEVNRICPVEDGPEMSFTVGFDDTSELVWPVVIDALEYDGLEFVVKVRIPGSEDWQDGGIWIRQGGELLFEYPEHCRERAWGSAGPMKKR